MLPGFCGCCSQAVWISLCMGDTHTEMRALGPQKRGTEGRDSCLDIACQLVRGSQTVRLQTEMLVDKGVLGCGWGSTCFVISLGHSYGGLSPGLLLLQLLQLPLRSWTLSCTLDSRLACLGPEMSSRGRRTRPPVNTCSADPAHLLSLALGFHGESLTDYTAGCPWPSWPIP